VRAAKAIIGNRGRHVNVFQGGGRMAHGKNGTRIERMGQIRTDQ